MITAAEALIIAGAAAFAAGWPDWIGSVVVTPQGSKYEVLMAASPSAGRADRDASVVVDARSGRAIRVQYGHTPAQPEAAPHGTAMPAAAAYQAALTALQGFDAYDRHGRLSILLRPDRYEITFPNPVGAPGSRGADYAVQVWLSPDAGRTLRILVAS